MHGAFNDATTVFVRMTTAVVIIIIIIIIQLPTGH